VTQPFLFAARAVDHVLAEHGQVALGFDLAMAPTPLLHGHKLGLGSSARAAVLATKATLAALDSAKDALPLALRAHADAQGGKGSGADVVACHTGGLVRYTRPSSPDAAPKVKSLHPESFALAYVFTGRSVSTPVMLEAVEARHDDRVQRAFVLSSEIWGEQLERAWLAGEFGALAEAVEALQSSLDDLLGGVSSVQEPILRLAKTYGCCAKQSGAGGGDGCILFAPDEEKRDEALEGLGRRGFWGTPLEVESGATMEPDNTPNTSETEMLKCWLARPEGSGPTKAPGG
jgi:phosphomevalonate kinase